jgi:hypothetical protein
MLRRYLAMKGGQTPLEYRFYPGTNFLQQSRKVANSEIEKFSKRLSWWFKNKKKKE